MPLATKQLSMSEVAQLCHTAGFRDANLLTSIAVIWAESRGNAWAININGSNPLSRAYGSIDIGLCQWNTYWWSIHKANDLMKPEYSVNLMFRVTKGQNFQYWNAWLYGHHKQFLPYAEAVCAELKLISVLG